MFQSPYIINRKRIGEIEFTALLYVDENNLLALAINFHNYDEPLLRYQLVKDENIIHVEINSSIFYHIQNLKSFDTNLRKIHFIQFKRFLIASTSTAHRIAHHDNEFHYTFDRDLKDYITQAFLYN